MLNKQLYKKGKEKIMQKTEAHLPVLSHYLSFSLYVNERHCWQVFVVKNQGVIILNCILFHYKEKTIYVFYIK